LQVSTTIPPYNHPTFPTAEDVEFFAAFFEHLKPGERAPDPLVYDLDRSESVQLAEITSGQALTVVELGSLT